MHVIAAKAQCFIEANTEKFDAYAQSVIDNAQAMANVFMKNGFKVLTEGTDSHIILMDLSDTPWSGRAAADLVPNDPRSFTETSGIRLGTAAITTLGFCVIECEQIAQDICDLLLSDPETYEG